MRYENEGITRTALHALQASLEAYACETMEASSGHFEEANAWNREGDANYARFVKLCDGRGRIGDYCYAVLRRYDRLKAAARLTAPVENLRESA